MPRSFPVDLSEYVHLRTMLDSVETGALRFYLEAATPEEEKIRYGYLKDRLMKIIEHVWKISVKPNEGPCPDGYYYCDGCCVSYECVFGGSGPKGQK